MNLTFKVQSHRNPKQFYEVTRIEQSQTIEYDYWCSCPHYGYRTYKTDRRCKHIEQVIEQIECGNQSETALFHKESF